MQISSDSIAPPPSGDFKYRVILIFDMNSFFASVELKNRPDLVGLPVIVGKIRRRKVVATASPEAKAYGVTKGMNSLKAVQLCKNKVPKPIWIDPHPLLYEEESDEIIKLVKNEMAVSGFSPTIQTVGKDEAYLDLTPYCQGATSDDSLNLARPVAERLKARILKERQLHCKIGIASNRFLAKVATDQKSPDGINIIYDKDWDTILPPLDVSEIPDVGEVTEKKLKDSIPSFKTIADIRNTPVGFDFRRFVGKQKFLAPILRDLAFGRDVRPVKANKPRDSFSRIETFEYDTADMKIICPFISEFANELSLRLKKTGNLARTVKVEYVYPEGKYEDWPKISRQKKADKGEFDDMGTIVSLATTLMQINKALETDDGKPRVIYSLNISVCDLVPASQQPLSLFKMA